MSICHIFVQFFSWQPLLAEASAFRAVATREAVRYFGALGSHCVLLVSTEEGQDVEMAHSVPVVTLSHDALEWKARMMCKDAVVILGTDRDLMDSCIAWIPVHNSIIFIADSLKSIHDQQRLRRLPKSLYFVTTSTDMVTELNNEYNYPFSVYSRPDYFGGLQETAMFNQDNYLMRGAKSQHITNMMPKPQIDFGGRDFPAVAFRFYPYSMPDYKTQTNHAGFEYEIVRTVTRYSKINTCF